MGLHGKLVAAIEYKSCTDLFHDLLMYNPNDLSIASPDKCQGCDLHEGDHGNVGSIICWSYTHDGKQRKAKEVIESIDEEKKSMKKRVIEGDLLEEYKSFYISFHVETHGGIDLVTWTLDYEMLNEDVGHPISLLSFFIDLTKDIEAHHA